MATSFSNIVGSFQSSLGFFLTEKTGYNGLYGYSLRIHGLEDKFNSNAYSRAIVIHGDESVSEDYIKDVGVLSRSLGCPVVPKELTKDIIDTLISGVSVVFISGNDEKYLKESTFIN